MIYTYIHCVFASICCRLEGKEVFRVFPFPFGFLCIQPRVYCWWRLWWLSFFVQVGRSHCFPFLNTDFLIQDIISFNLMSFQMWPPAKKGKKLSPYPHHYCWGEGWAPWCCNAWLYGHCIWRFFKFFILWSSFFEFIFFDVFFQRDWGYWAWIFQSIDKFCIEKLYSHNPRPVTTSSLHFYTMISYRSWPLVVSTSIPWYDMIWDGRSLLGQPLEIFL